MPLIQPANTLETHLQIIDRIKTDTWNTTLKTPLKEMTEIYNEHFHDTFERDSNPHKYSPIIGYNSYGQIAVYGSPVLDVLAWA